MPETLSHQERTLHSDEGYCPHVKALEKSANPGPREIRARLDARVREKNDWNPRASGSTKCFPTYHRMLLHKKRRNDGVKTVRHHNAEVLSGEKEGKYVC